MEKTLFDPDIKSFGTLSLCVDMGLCVFSHNGLLAGQYCIANRWLHSQDTAGKLAALQACVYLTSQVVAF